MNSLTIKRPFFVITIQFLVLALSGCSKGKSCLCEKYSYFTDEYEGSVFTEDYQTCTGAQYVLDRANDHYYHYCYDYYDYLDGQE